MLTKEMNKFSTKFQQLQSGCFCHECGAGMMEVERRNENHTLYVWYECSRKSCDGQWLQKMPVSA